MKSHFSHWLVLLLILATATAAVAAERQACHLCGMYIDQYQHTAALLTERDGKETATCGVADMIRFIEDSGGPDAFTSIKVVEWGAPR